MVITGGVEYWLLLETKHVFSGHHNLHHSLVLTLLVYVHVHGRQAKVSALQPLH